MSIHYAPTEIPVLDFGVSFSVVLEGDLLAYTFTPEQYEARRPQDREGEHRRDRHEHCGASTRHTL